MVFAAIHFYAEDDAHDRHHDRANLSKAWMSSGFASIAMKLAR
jgi:hypothetical protein